MHAAKIKNLQAIKCFKWENALGRKLMMMPVILPARVIDLRSVAFYLQIFPNNCNLRETASVIYPEKTLGKFLKRPKKNVT
jgi:hypothetical protein